MNTAAPQKTCHRCKMDVADRPRTKDPKGRYFCIECYDAAVAQKRRARGESTAGPPARRAATQTNSAPAVSPAPPIAAPSGFLTPLPPPSAKTIARQFDHAPAEPFHDDDSIPLIDSSEETHADGASNSVSTQSSTPSPEIGEHDRVSESPTEDIDEPTPLLPQADEEEVAAFADPIPDEIETSSESALAAMALDDEPSELTPAEIESIIEFAEEPVATQEVLEESPVDSQVESPRPSTLFIVEEHDTGEFGDRADDEDFAAQASQPELQSNAPPSAIPKSIVEPQGDPSDSFFDSAALSAPVEIEQSRTLSPVIAVPAIETRPPHQAVLDPVAALPLPIPAAQPSARSPQVMLLEDGPPAAAFSGCPHCRKPITTGAIVCLSCGYNILTGEVNPDAVQKPFVGLPARSTWRGPMLAGSMLTLATIAAAYLLFGTRAGFIGFGIALLITVPSWFAWALADARETEGAQLKISLVPGYIFAWIFGQSRSRYLRAVTVGVIAIVLAFIALGYEWKRIERQQQRAHLRQSPSADP